MSRSTVAGKARTRRPRVLAAVMIAALLVLIAVIIAAIAGGSGTGSAPRPTPAADPVAASSLPAVLPVVYWQADGWHGGQVRPAAIYVGQGGSPYVKALRWPSWTAAGARANGYLYMQKPGCVLPTYQCPYQRFRVQVQLGRVQTHNGTRYYSRMRWTYFRNHVSHAIGWKTYRGYWRN